VSSDRSFLPSRALFDRANVAIAAGVPIKIMSRRSLSDYQRNWPLVAKLERRLHARMDARRDHGIRAELEELPAARGISHRIQFLGEHSDIPRLLAAANFGLLSSREEGFSNVILECVAAGLAMIVTDVGGNAAVLHAETGLVVPPIKAIGEAILRAGARKMREVMRIFARKCSKESK
jgi:glycosyltransferase involved in cell wall biosynthesis